MPDRDATGRFASTDRALVPAPTSTVIEPAAAAANPRATGGRLTTDTTDWFGGNAPWVLVPPPTAQQTWDLARIDDLAFGRYSPERIVNLMIDLSPDTSRGLWDYLRFMNPGYDILAMQPGTDKPMPTAQKAVDDLQQVLADRYGTPDLVWNRQACGMFLRGALFTELVLDQDGRIPVDIATPDPMTARFYRVPDPVLVGKWQLAQMQAGKIQVLDRPTVRYVPIDPVPGSPYGRSIVAPALFSSVFLLLILHDLRRVIAQQGWPRHDITVDVQKIKEQMPEDKKRDPKAVNEWAAKTINEVQSAYYALEPDMAFTHTEVVTVNKPQGAVDDSSLGAIDPLMRGLERMVSRGIKSVPFLMGLDQTADEARGIREWESYNQSIKAQQKLIAATDAGLIRLGMQSQGIQCEIKMSFEEVRGSEAQRDEQVRALKLANAKQAYYLGYVSQEQASQYAWGTAPNQKEPRLIETTEQVDPLGDAAIQALGDQVAENPDKKTKSGKAQTRRTNASKRAKSDDGSLTEAEKEATVSAFDELFAGTKFVGLLEAGVTA